MLKSEEYDYLNNMIMFDRSTKILDAIFRKGRIEIHNLARRNLHQKEIDRLIEANVEVSGCFELFD